MLLSDGFLLSAKRRFADIDNLTEADIRQAISDLYYSLFHAVCEDLASLIRADDGKLPAKEAWLSLYRLPDHQLLSKRCGDGRIREFSSAVSQFAQQLKALRELRNLADYAVEERFETSLVKNRIEVAETALRNYKKAPVEQRQQFVVFVSLKSR